MFCAHTLPFEHIHNNRDFYIKAVVLFWNQMAQCGTSEASGRDYSFIDLRAAAWIAS